MPAKGESKVFKEIQICKVNTTTHIKLFYAEGGICAGFPSPAGDYMEIALDLNERLIKNPASTFYGKVCGNSLEDANLEDGDILVIDTSLAPVEGDVVLCCIDGDFTVKFLKYENGNIILMPANKAYPPIQITENCDFRIWGVVTANIHIRRKL